MASPVMGIGNYIDMMRQQQQAPSLGGNIPSWGPPNGGMGQLPNGPPSPLNGGSGLFGMQTQPAPGMQSGSSGGGAGMYDPRSGIGPSQAAGGLSPQPNGFPPQRQSPWGNWAQGPGQVPGQPNVPWGSGSGMSGPGQSGMQGGMPGSQQGMYDPNSGIPQGQLASGLQAQANPFGQSGMQNGMQSTAMHPFVQALLNHPAIQSLMGNMGNNFRTAGGMGGPSAWQHPAWQHPGTLGGMAQGQMRWDRGGGRTWPALGGGPL